MATICCFEVIYLFGGDPWTSLTFVRSSMVLDKSHCQERALFVLVGLDPFFASSPFTILSAVSIASWLVSGGYLDSGRNGRLVAGPYCERNKLGLKEEGEEEPPSTFSLPVFRMGSMLIDVSSGLL
jgi:hypothetical protein